jgi:hypothetical protein
MALAKLDHPSLVRTPVGGGAVLLRGHIERYRASRSKWDQYYAGGPSRIGDLMHENLRRRVRDPGPRRSRGGRGVCSPFPGSGTNRAACSRCRAASSRCLRSVDARPQPMLLLDERHGPRARHDPGGCETPRRIREQGATPSCRQSAHIALRSPIGRTCSRPVAPPTRGQLVES